MVKKENELQELIQRGRFTILSEPKTIDGETMSVMVPWIKADSKNLNGRIYPKALLQQEISRVQKAVESGAFIGTGDHPASGFRDNNFVF